LENHGDFINKTFSLPSLSKIVDALERDGKEFSQELLATMKKCSPLAMLVTFEQIQRGNELDLANCLKMEYRMTQHFMEDPNFFEGVRALLVDKDKNPKWNPATLAEVSDETVAKFFTNVDFELSLLDRKSQ
jgi:3-hydroxyisobutyryl-CoA hydrolase